MNKNTVETLKKYFGYASFREGQDQVKALNAAGIRACRERWRAFTMHSAVLGPGCYDR